MKMKRISHSNRVYALLLAIVVLNIEMNGGSFADKLRTVNNNDLCTQTKEIALSKTTGKIFTQR